MKKVRFCKECKWSVKSKSTYEIRCKHPLVVMNDPWALSRMNCGNEYDGFESGKSCHEERSKKWFAKCGLKGKLWEENDKLPRNNGYIPTVDESESNPPGEE